MAVRGSYENWAKAGKKQIWERAAEYKEKRIESYTRPEIDPSIEKELIAFVEKRKKEIEG